jgi:hypothetical protein
MYTQKVACIDDRRLAAIGSKSGPRTTVLKSIIFSLFFSISKDAGVEGGKYTREENRQPDEVNYKTQCNFFPFRLSPLLLAKTLSREVA